MTGGNLRGRMAWALFGLYVVLVILGFRFQAQVATIALADAWALFALGWVCVVGALILGTLNLFRATRISLANIREEATAIRTQQHRRTQSPPPSAT